MITLNWVRFLFVYLSIVLSRTVRVTYLLLTEKNPYLNVFLWWNLDSRKLESSGWLDFKGGGMGISNC